MSLSLHWPSCVTFNWSVWHNSTESPRMKRALWFFSPLVTLVGDFSLVTLVEGRAWDGKSDSKWISTKTQLWCINILANLNHKSLDRARLSRFRSLSEQADENSKGAITSEADPWKSQCCDPSNSLPGLIYSWAALRGPQTNVKSTVTPSLMNSADGAKTLNSILASGRVSLWRSKDLKQRQQRWWWWWHTPWLQTLWNYSGVAGKLRGPTVVPSSPRAR